MSPLPARDRFLTLLGAAIGEGTLVKLTLGKARAADPTLQNLFVRPVTLKAGPQLTLVWRHATRDLTKNLPPAEALALLEPLIGTDFLDAHLFTTAQSAQLECQPDGTARLRQKSTAAPAIDANPSAPTLNSPSRRSHAKADQPPTLISASHDQPKHHLIPATAPWLRTLGITNDHGQPRAEMAAKFRQIQKFAELLRHLVADTPLPSDRPLQIVDMGCGKGYLTFAVAELLGERARVRGIETRPELVEFCNRAAATHGLASRLAFTPGTIADAELSTLDILIALHACDTATDDALARGLAAGAALLVVAPCCQKELRPQLTAPPVLADALRHGIFQERHAEFVTDALRAQLLEWAGCRTKVFEFISTEHTAKNTLIVAQRLRPAGAPDDARAAGIREFARFYGIRHHALATQLKFPL